MDALRRARSIAGLTSRTARAAAVELTWIGAHVVLYPLGVLAEKTLPSTDRFTLRDLPPNHRALLIGDVEAAGTPIVLIHGVVDNRSIFTVLRRGLRRRGFGRILGVNYSPLSDDVRDVAERVRDTVEELCAETGYERVHLIGHSMGGLVARYYVQRLGGDQRVHTVVTLGTPHSGTYAARLVPHPVARQLRPGSDLIAELAEPAPGCKTRFVAFWSDFDQMVIPTGSARLEHPDLAARNVFVRGVGHLSLPIDGRVVHEIGATLAHLDADGHTVQAGVTSIESAPAAGSRNRRIQSRTRACEPTARPLR
jgi:pimeloyl-ACP methyl ester carboxylesterase